MIRTVTRCRCCQSIAIDGLVFDRTRRELRCGDQGVRLEPAMAAVVGALLASDGRMIRHDQLLYAVYGQRIDGGPDSSENAVKVYVHRLRRVLASLGAPVAIRNVRGEGYRLDAINTLIAPTARAIDANAIEEVDRCPA